MGKLPNSDRTSNTTAFAVALAAASAVALALTFTVVPSITAPGLSLPALAKGVKKPLAKAAPRQVIYSLPGEQLNSEILKVWAVPACVLMGAERPRGLYITGFTGEGLGNSLGLETGDVLLSLNGHVLMDARQADSVLAHTRSGQLKAVVARPANVAGGITLLQPKIMYTADPLNQSYSAASSSSSSGASSSTSAPTEMTISALEDYMLTLVNEDRRANGGLPPLNHSSQLGALARRYAEDMKTRHFFEHTDPDGFQPMDRARRAGINVSVWENLAKEIGPSGSRSLVARGEQQMMDEPPNVPNNHRGCILNQRHHCVGIGVAIDGHTVYMAQEFSPADVP